MPGKRPSVYQALPHLEYMVYIKYGLELDDLDCIVVFVAISYSGYRPIL